MEANSKEPKPIISFRPMARGDFPLFQKWLQAPHVKQWWKEQTTLEAIEKKYGPRVDGERTTRCFVTVIDNKPVGMVQSYWIKDEKEYSEAVRLEDSVGIDWFIGEESYLSKGLASKIAKSFMSTITKEI